MLALGPLSLMAPLALAGLAALPVIWLLLRATPPAPRRRVFPPLALLFGLRAEEETPQRTPWWLVVLRLLIAALAILGLARPVLFPAAPAAGAGPVIVVVDDGWASTPNWRRMRAAAEARLDAARQEGRSAALVFTAPVAGAVDEIQLEDPADARRRLAERAPRAWAPDRALAAERIAAARAANDLPAAAAPVWIADGLAHDAAAATELAETLAAFGDGQIIAPDPARAPLGLRPLETVADGFAVDVVRAEPGPAREGSISAYDADGRALARAGFAFAEDAVVARAEARLPLALRNEAAIARIDGAGSSGGAQILDDAWRRPLIGLAAAGALEDRQPLLADLHYVERALEPVAETRRGAVAELLELSPGAVILADVGRVVGPEAAALERYVNDGGLLIRFAGPRLAERADNLVPTRLRPGGRALGGALGWDEPQTIAPFPDDSPFFGLEIPDDVTVTRQVLAEPVAELDALAWARLEDGTPLVTSARRGRGRVVLFHVTATPDWSNLPLSGLFPDMLARAAAFAAAGAQPADAETGAAWRLAAALDADGRLSSTQADARIEADAFEDAAPGPRSPPGRYARGGASRALNVLDADAALAPLPEPPAGLVVVTEAGPAPMRLGGTLLAAALALMIVDALAAGLLAGLIASPFRRAGPRAAGAAGAAGAGLVAALGLGMVMLAPDVARAQALTDDEAFAIEALSEIRLAYVITGDADTDEMSRAGLAGLSRELTRRTSVEPGAPLGVDVETIDVALLPMLYWVVEEDTPAPSPEAAARLDQFLRTGGVLVFDTRDAADAALRGGSPHPGLARIIEAIDIPALAPVPDDHVLTRAFYLMQEFPGRWTGAPVWVEADTRGSARDGVSSVVVGAADWAAAWAVDDAGRPLAALSPGGDRQREMAYRFGINLMMYVLTGNYKSDQVHVPDILERLGQ